MDYICMEIIETGERRRIDGPVWAFRQRNGAVVRTPHRAKAKGVGDGDRLWSLGALEGYPLARIITRAEYEESLAAPVPDPVLTAEEALNIILGGNYETE